MPLSAKFFLIIIVYLILLCEGRRRSYGDDSYYQDRIQNVQEEIYRRSEDLVNDKYNLKENRPTGRFSYAGHQEQLDNKIRHLENLQQEYNGCISSGMCGGNHNTYQSSDTVPMFLTSQRGVPNQPGNQPTTFNQPETTAPTQRPEEIPREFLLGVFVIFLLVGLWDVWNQNVRKLLLVALLLCTACVNCLLTDNEVYWKDPLAWTLFGWFSSYVAVTVGLQSVLLTKHRQSYFVIGLDLCKNIAILQAVSISFLLWYFWVFNPPIQAPLPFVGHLALLVADIDIAFVICCMLYLLIKVVSTCFLCGQYQIVWNRVWMLSFLLSSCIVFVAELPPILWKSL
mmetsp:Transcript_1271/g.1720  ORF Transcript_1271/g.1720 Transcript_1271/m.1720 type:complete len:341 (-) Transcript_1271:72-1094(-)